VITKIWEEIRKGILAPLYVLYGKDPFFITETEKMIIDRALDENGKEMNLTVYDMEETPVEIAVDDCETFPFFGNSKVVVLKRPYFLTGDRPKDSVEHRLERLESYIRNPQPTTVLIFHAPYEKLDERKKLTKLLKQQAVWISGDGLPEREARELVKRRIRDWGMEMEEDAMDLLVQYTGGTLSLMLEEAEKLALYCRGMDRIRKEDVECACSKTLEGNIFTLVDQILRKNLEGVLDIYRHLLKQNEEPIKIAAIIASQFRLLSAVKELSRKGYGQNQIASMLKVHPYRVKLAVGQSRSFTREQLLKMICRLSEIDYRMKSGWGDRERMLEYFFLEFLHE
jgi:DNA polymerase III, delta subunit